MNRFILFTLLTIMVYSCIKPCSLDRESLINSALVIYPFNSAADDYFYPEIESRSPFKRDSLQVLDENGNKYPFVSFILKSDPRNRLNGFYAIDIAPAFRIPQDNDAFVTEKTKKIYLHYNYNTADTLTLVFKSKRLKCDASAYEYLKIYHRNKLIASISNNILADFTLTH